MSNRQIRKLREEAKKYRWINGSFGVPADVAGEELDRIRTVSGGALNAPDIVDAARPEHAPLHPVFEWDDKKAAESFRHNQARTMVRALVVVTPEKENEHRAYYHTVVEGQSKPTYAPAVEVVNNPAMFAEASKRLAADLARAQRSVKELENLASNISIEPERMARISMAMRAIEAAGVAVAALH